MNQSEMYEIPVAVGKEVAYVRVYRDEQDRQVLVGFANGMGGSSFAAGDVYLIDQCNRDFNPH